MLLVTDFCYDIFSSKLHFPWVLPGITKIEEVLPQNVANFFFVTYCYPVTFVVTI